MGRVARHEGRHRHEPGRPGGNAFHRPQKCRPVLGIGGLGPGIPRRVHPGRATERIHLEPGVVGESRHAGRRRHGPRLEKRIGIECGAGLGDVGPHVAVQDLDPGRHPGEHGFDLDDLVGVLGREDQSHPPRAAFCSSTRREIPAAARSRRASRSGRVNGAPSAVPCTSISSPAPVMTTFMSTAAATSCS